MARINRVIELLEQGQPVYYAGAGELTYEQGREQAGEVRVFKASIQHTEQPTILLSLPVFCHPFNNIIVYNKLY